MNAEIHTKMAARVYPDALHAETYRDGARVHFQNCNDVRNFNLLETDSNGEPTQQAKASALDTLTAFHLTAYRYTTGLYGARHCMGSTDQMDAPTVCVAIFEAAKKELKGAFHEPSA